MLCFRTSTLPGLLLLTAAACSDKHTPAPSLDGRWNATRHEVTRYDYGQMTQSYENTGFHDNYISFSGTNCEISEPGLGKSQYTYVRQGDTLVLTPTQPSWLPLKSAVVQHTKATLQLRTATELAPGIKLVSLSTYAR
jgi:hypothetical protein